MIKNCIFYWNMTIALSFMTSLPKNWEADLEPTLTSIDGAPNSLGWNVGPQIYLSLKRGVGYQLFSVLFSSVRQRMQSQCDMIPIFLARENSTKNP